MGQGSIQILLIEDNPLHAHLLAGFLAEIGAERFPVVRAESLVEGLRLAKEQAFDVVLLDLVLPDATGLDTFLRWKAEFPSIPVVVLTGLDDMELATRAVENGAEDYLLKSQINGALLSRSLRYTVERSRVGSEEWDTPLLRVAHQQYMKAVQHMDISEELRTNLLYPQRAQFSCLGFTRDREGEVFNIFAYRVQHLQSFGPSLGGLRFHQEVSLGGLAALAMGLSWKCALMKLPFGGACGGIRVDPSRLEPAEKERLTRSYIQEISHVLGPQRDVITPGLGADAEVMNWVLAAFVEQTEAPAAGVVTGTSTSWECADQRETALGKGLALLVERAAEEIALPLKGARAVIQGFGTTGRSVARALSALGLKIVAVSDRQGALFLEQGLDLDALVAHVQKSGSLVGFEGAEELGAEKILELPCELLVPCALERQITAENATRLRCRMVAEGANSPTSAEADEILAERDIFLLPDLLANAGGLVFSYLEWLQATSEKRVSKKECEEQLRERMLDGFERALARSRKEHLDLRTAAIVEAVEEISRRLE